MTKEYLATFFTHSGAIKYNRYLKSQGFSVDLMPVPRKLSSNCGIAAKFKCDTIDIKTMISEDIEQLFGIEESNYKLLYKTNED
ncbi:DUF3343 domain-containing protein [Sporosalibacterium faouarense]|uniref:DUF3343 domain-containing protein n=1 Tax=Sporosalibacterium faouarense TaxID=516123 RepID=UPI00141D4CCB|nr:DUF3343 domain-containing protein [Sporosalibacterium faouarense]MTI47216.1 DUF3343 domain-containing protein [Bacillota bacterium]